MYRMTTSAMLAALLAAGATAALAADPPAAAGPMTPLAPTSAEAVTATHLLPGQLRGTDLRGADVHDTQDRKIATVKDLVLDRDGRVSLVVLEVDGKHVALAMKDLRITADQKNKPRIAVDLAKDELKAAEAFDLGARAASGGSLPPGSGAR